RIEGSGVFEIPVGPVHAGIIEPGHFRFSVAGEPIINLEAKLYYVHKGIEKLAENQSFEKVFFLSERISGDETVTNSLAYCLALEKMAGMDDLPEKADYIRTILCELERIYNHLGDIAGLCIDVAYSFAAYQFNMMRRWCMILNEELTGSRYLRSSIKPGGVRKDFIAGKEKILIASLDKLEKEFRETADIIKSNSLLIDRVENTGVIKPDIALDLNAVGPVGRSAGINRDIRRDLPYAAYEKLKFNVPIHKNGDVNCRMNIKIEELLESIAIIKQCVELIPAGRSVSEPLPPVKPYSYAFGLTESPRGENFHWLMSGEQGTVFRYKIRTPSFNNWPVLCHAVKGNVVPDFPLINKSFNLSYSGNDL
ncbi:MAG: pyridine nucleotide-disulfide oxidoreductase, partial [Clostridiales bacterium]|nr:pyridine nucleotide-disulfide oxidoreductase [Clostridiales bacterium]